ncbi:YlcI/YnfO family protein [Vibrio sp. 99-70-13A1]|uniref:YlcI/YnfO family protein n=1 Tax=Vibrio sp. 99-70-13A1 TaxID=2607601 RepID=UPI001493BF2B|nr:YlcI/YnfO family protein [Vibrio sp. 99-70-13A1]NOH98984.1 hypothetical protein [Vibrio sp. 99-70-13A1]
MDKFFIVINTNTNKKSSKKNIRFEHELIMEIEAVKSKGISFSEWVKQACHEKVTQEKNNREMCAHSKNLDLLGVGIGDKTQVDTHAAEANYTIVTQVKLWHSQGMFHQQIADRLNNIGCLNLEGKKWSRVAVRRLVSGE